MKKNEENILIVEDQLMSRKYLEDILRSMGYKNTYTASNAKDALEIAKEHNIKLVFMDINLEGSMDGVQCAFALNEKKQHPIIYISAYTDSQTISDAGDTNLYGYIFKPYNEKDVHIAMQIAKKHIFRAIASPTSAEEKIVIDKNCFYNTKLQILLINQQEVHLTKKEILLIELLLHNQNKIVRYEELKKSVWQKDVSESTVRDAILRLRKKAPLLEIINRFGVGYILNQE